MSETRSETASPIGFVTIAEVTDSTPSSLEYGDYRGFVGLDPEGQWVRDLTATEADAMRGRRLIDSEGYGACYEVDPGGFVSPQAN